MEVTIQQTLHGQEDGPSASCACGCGEPVKAGQRFVSTHNFRQAGSLSARWTGGRRMLGTGYVYVQAPAHPRANRHGYVFEHILVAEGALGRFLPDEAQVHHFDGNRSRNVGGNLVICPDYGYHSLLHRRQRAFAACGDPNARRCVICHQYDRQENITVTTGGRNGRPYHRTCKAAAEAARKARMS